MPGCAWGRLSVLAGASGGACWCVGGCLPERRRAAGVHRTCPGVPGECKTSVTSAEGESHAFSDEQQQRARKQTNAL